jgi:hypothetical protein
MVEGKMVQTGACTQGKDKDKKQPYPNNKDSI